MQKVYVKFPKVGLGNMLLVWARAVVFAHLNHLPLITSPWWSFHPGAWKRNENKKRLYWGYFKESSYWSRLEILLNKYQYQLIEEPVVKELTAAELEGKKIYRFDKVIVENDLFASIRDYRDLVREGIYKILKPSLLEQLKSYPPPVIAVHIRRGDFKLGNPVTPQSFFIDCINQVRSVAGENWEVTVFTDADADEISEVLALPAVTLASPKPDILDILLMSKSKVIILSQSSTFSYWGAFLSDAVILKPAGDWQQKIRDEAVNNVTPEIKWKEGDERCLEIFRSFINNKNRIYASE